MTEQDPIAKSGKSTETTDGTQEHIQDEDSSSSPEVRDPRLDAGERYRDENGFILTIVQGPDANGDVLYRRSHPDQDETVPYSGDIKKPYIEFVNQIKNFGLVSIPQESSSAPEGESVDQETQEDTKVVDTVEDIPTDDIEQPVEVDVPEERTKEPSLEDSFTAAEAAVARHAQEVAERLKPESAEVAEAGDAEPQQRKVLEQPDIPMTEAIVKNHTDSFAKGQGMPDKIISLYDVRIKKLEEERAQIKNKKDGRTEIEINNEIALVTKAQEDMKLRGGDEDLLAKTKVENWSKDDIGAEAKKLEGALKDVTKRKEVAYDSKNDELRATFKDLKKFEKKLKLNTGDAKNLETALSSIDTRNSNIAKAQRALENTPLWRPDKMATLGTKIAWNEGVKVHDKFKAWESNKLLSANSWLERQAIKTPRRLLKAPLYGAVAGLALFFGAVWGIGSLSWKALKKFDASEGGYGIFKK